MQFHYVVMFDTTTNKWTIENEAPYLADGNVWDDALGWFVPTEYDEDDRAYVIDERAYSMLTALVPIWPAVDTEV